MLQSFFVHSTVGNSSFVLCYFRPVTESSEELSFTQWRTHLNSLLDYALSQQQQQLSSDNTGRTPARGSASNKLAELFPKYLKLDTTISPPASVSNESSNIEMKGSNSASFSQAVFTVSSNRLLETV